MRLFRRLMLSFFLFLLALPATAQTVGQPLALRHATVVDVRDGGLLPDQTVLIAGNRIEALGPSATTPLPSGVKVIDIEGRYLIPGLWDMHAHVFFDGMDGYLALMVANGITGFREMGNSPLSFADIRKVRSDIESRVRIGPRFRAAGVLFDGPNSRWSEGVVVAATPERGRALVDSVAAEGADFIKVYSYLQADVYAAIVEQAQRRKLPVSGHVPYVVRAEDASKSGQRSFEHLIGIEDGCSTDELALVELSRQQLRLLASGDTAGADSLEREWRRRVLVTQDEARCQALFKLFRENGTFQVPTLVQQGRPQCVDTEALARDPRLKYVPRSSLSWWPAVIEGTRGADLESQQELCSLRTAQVGMMGESGVPLMAGTDAGWPWVIWGFSLHEELELLVQAGLSPLQALQTATLNPARYLGATDYLGTVETGKLADLVLLDKNPLEDIRNTQKISAVVLNGRYLDREALAALLGHAERAARAPDQTPRPQKD